MVCFTNHCRARDGNGAWQIFSQHEHAIRGRTMRFTTNLPGMYSSSSVTSSLIARKLPPQAQVSPGDNTSSLRGNSGGNGLRLGLSFFPALGSSIEGPT